MVRVRNLFGFLNKESDSGVFRQIPLDIAGRLYTSPMPYGAYDYNSRLIKIYKHHKINHVFMLVTDEEIEKKARKDLFKLYDLNGITWSRYAFRDFESPSLEALTGLVDEAVKRVQSERVLIHCHAGVGRTSVAASCVVMAVQNMPAKEAINYVKKFMTVNITSEQINLIKKFEMREAV